MSLMWLAFLVFELNHKWIIVQVVDTMLSGLLFFMMAAHQSRYSQSTLAIIADVKQYNVITQINLL